MKKGLLTTLFAAAFSFSGIPAAFAIAPVISTIPDITVGDMEDNVPVSTDNNFFIFTNAFQFSTHVSDADTADGNLRWSFGEFTTTLATPQYTINGKEAVNQGSTAIATDQGAGSPRALNPAAPPVGPAGDFMINGSSDYATVRDILFSPTPGSGPFPDPSGPNAAAAALGRPVRFYVADPDGNLTSQTVLINTVDDGYDALSPASILDPTNVDEDNFGSTGWIPTGFDSGTIMDTTPPSSYFFDPGSTNDVDKTSDTDKLKIIVSTSQHRWRSTGFENSNMIAHPGSTKWIRGKFYVYTDNSLAAPMNQVPGFRARLTTPGYYNSLYIESARTGNTGPIDPVVYADAANATTVESTVSPGLVPSRTASKPSLYRLDFDPADVAAELTRPIGALFEAYAFTNPTSGTISLTECEVGAYPVQTGGTNIMTYSRATTAQSQGFGPGVATFVANVEANLEVGRKPNYYIAALGDVETYGTVTESAGASSTGISVNTAGVPTNRNAIVSFTLNPATNANKVRHAPGKLYRASFYLTSNLASMPNIGAANTVDRQAPLRISLNAMGGVALVHMDMNGGYIASSAPFDTPSYQIGKAALPGNGGGVNGNPSNDALLNPAGYTGGWYTVMTSSLLDPDIRQDNAGSQAPLSSQPGPGSSSASFLDMDPGAVGIKLARFMRMGPAPFDNVEIAAENNARWSCTAAVITEYNQINDGGYGY